ncbi:MAG TPA: metallophosphoesterase [Longimicrobium sp.]|nr:metallophosphoesterase [Longimicrobium sp.]
MRNGRSLWARRAAVLGGACALLASAACARPQYGVGRVIVPVPLDSVALNLVLIGDAGLPAPGDEPVLTALRRELSAAPERSFVVWLGDNIYPIGLTDTTAAEGKEGLRIIRQQMRVLRETSTRGIFVPGNHDWAAGAGEGWANVVRQERVVNTEGAGLIGWEPRDGCPGPVVVDVGAVLRILAIDSQWWLHGGAKPGPDRCTPGTEQGVIDSIRVALASAGDRRTLIVAHHPIVSGGQHGGYFDWPTYLFPFHPWARLTGLFARQDVTGREYRHFTQSLARAFIVDTPLVYAAGHEHNLQVFRRDPAKYLVVSGAGFYGHTTTTRAITGIRYVREASGYQRLTFLQDGRVRLSVMVVDAQGNATEDYSAWLEAPPLSAPFPPPSDVSPPVPPPVVPPSQAPLPPTPDPTTPATPNSAPAPASATGSTPAQTEGR